MWGVVKTFIEAHTVNKIRILRESKPLEMRCHFAPRQYEEKYGGTAPNATVFWPPNLPEGPYESENEDRGSHLLPLSSHQLYFPIPQDEYKSISRESEYFSARSEFECTTKNTFYFEAVPHDFRNNENRFTESRNYESRFNESRYNESRVYESINNESRNDESANIVHESINHGISNQDYHTINDDTVSLAPTSDFRQRKKYCCEKCYLI